MARRAAPGPRDRDHLRDGFDLAEEVHRDAFRLADARNRFLRKNQDMRGRLRVDVADGENQIVFVKNRCRNFARDDFFKKCFAHGFSFLIHSFTR